VCPARGNDRQTAEGGRTCRRKARPYRWPGLSPCLPATQSPRIQTFPSGDSGGRPVVTGCVERVNP
jgi:hypothetical protein